MKKEGKKFLPPSLPLLTLRPEKKRISSLVFFGLYQMYEPNALYHLMCSKDLH